MPRRDLISSRKQENESKCRKSTCRTTICRKLWSTFQFFRHFDSLPLFGFVNFRERVQLSTCPFDSLPRRKVLILTSGSIRHSFDTGPPMFPVCPREVEQKQRPCRKGSIIMKRSKLVLVFATFRARVHTQHKQDLQRI